MEMESFHVEESATRTSRRKSALESAAAKKAGLRLCIVVTGLLFGGYFWFFLATDVQELSRSPPWHWHGSTCSWVRDKNGGTPAPWSALDTNSRELWDFAFTSADEVAGGLLSLKGNADRFADKKGVARLTLNQAPDGAGGEHPRETCLHPGKVYLKTHYNHAKASQTKKPLNLQFENALFGMKRLALNPVATDCTGIVELVAPRVYQTTSISGPGTAPVRVFHDGTFLGLYTANEWATDDAFLDRAFPGARGNRTTRIWEGRDANSLEYIGKDPVLYEKGCQEEGCTFCKWKDNVAGMHVCNKESGIGKNCSNCDREYTPFENKYCCAWPKKRSPYTLCSELNQTTEGEGYHDLAMLSKLLHTVSNIKNVEEETILLQKLESTLNVQALLESAAVDLMIGTWDGFWGSGNNYFLHQSGARSVSDRSSPDDIGYWSLFQFDLDMTFTVPPTGGQYDSRYTVQWPFASGLSMCCVPWKEGQWPTQASQGNGVLDHLISIPKYHGKLIELLEKQVDHASELKEMFQAWSDIVIPVRKAELGSREVNRWIPTLKELEKCSAENLQKQLEYYLDWIDAREAYLRKEMKELANVDQVTTVV